MYRVTEPSINGYDYVSDVDKSSIWFPFYMNTTLTANLPPKSVSVSCESKFISQVSVINVLFSIFLLHHVIS